MTKGRRIRLLEDYISLLEKENASLIGLSWVHGWRAPQSDVDEGERLRAALKWEERLKRREVEDDSKSAD